ncbi:MAG: hypothetical protein COV57_03190 [Candidatus Liptonbacteria bacterium CG11_big_fil_rev_8_21_14_0_20_35_14]|uniref:PD-(D/E)XK endonuclease-like domain-containing protein n=1 Tax=Candidatus Liptonbacteria bacterium CG11_big_fil_rev_8_21_14_0_20_35_14 TaxID=1974634 RepID=A0A2H0N6X9_9BACT|nr:MAG: hypothetical protein COV57_03190 [Candidatus Liptonbacteria bacterium CG11_big_fil_rev_8_21_14_0_20_35_14]
MSDSGHEIEGIWYPRVTTIMDIKSKPALYHFYSAVGFANGEKIKEQSANEGTLVHEAIEAILVGEEPIIDASIEPSILAFKTFLEKTPIKTRPELIEQKIIHKEYRYAGTADAVVTIGDRLGILDIKTSKSIYRDYNLQTAAYFDVLKKDYPELSTRWIMRIDQVDVCEVCGATMRRKGGRDKITKPWPAQKACSPANHVWKDTEGIVELKEFPGSHTNDFEAFLSAKRLWEWENEFWLKRIGYL